MAVWDLPGVEVDQGRRLPDGPDIRFDDRRGSEIESSWQVDFINRARYDQRVVRTPGRPPGHLGGRLAGRHDLGRSSHGRRPCDLRRSVTQSVGHRRHERRSHNDSEPGRVARQGCRLLSTSAERFRQGGCNANRCNGKRRCAADRRLCERSAAVALRAIRKRRRRA